MAEVLIVGSGLFGASLALELAETTYKGKADRITVLDRKLGGPSADAASSDINKVVRQDYADGVYSKLAFEAIDGWTGPRWQSYYHETGTVIYGEADDKGSQFVRDSFRRQRDLGIPVTFLPDPSSIRSKLPQTIPLASFEGCVGYHSPRGGWAWATGAMNELVRLAAESGCKFVKGTATRLCRVDGRVVGVELDDGARLEAEKTVLAAGSWSPRLLPEIRSSCVATGQSLAMVQLSPEEAQKYTTPVLMNLANEFYLLPPNKDGLLKFAFHGSGYENPETGPDGAPVSTPRTKHTTGDLSEGIPRPVLADLRDAVRDIYPALAAKPFADSRLCWYSDTPDANFLVGHHPTLASLFIATGGSGHAFKFLPILGRYLRASLEGTLDADMRELWSVERKRGDEDPARPGKEGRRMVLKGEDLARGDRGDYEP